MHPKIPTPERAKGEKSRYYTDIRQKLDKMERDEWRAWFVECIAELQKNKELWNFITRERVWEKKWKKGIYQKTQDRVGRPVTWHKGLNYPDTRNMDWDNEI